LIDVALLVKPTPTIGAPPTVIPGVPNDPVLFPVVCIPPICVEPIVEPVVGLLEPIEPNVLPKLLDGEEPVVGLEPLLPLVESDDPFDESPVEAYIPEDGVVWPVELGEVEFPNGDEEVGDEDPNGDEEVEDDDPNGDDEDPNEEDEDPNEEEEEPNPPEIPVFPAMPVPMPVPVPVPIPGVIPVC
jgi:hypothetical protein